jgi:septal ring factor EnvC (AmiA/AmiB activator)
MRLRLFSVIFCLPLVLAACALTQMQREIPQKEHSIYVKESELRDLEDQQKKLAEEKQRLRSEIDSKRMTADDLYAKLDNLRRENARIKASTDQQRDQKKSFEMRVRQYMSQINALKNNAQLPEEEKKRRIQELKDQIKLYLQMGS